MHCECLFSIAIFKSKLGRYKSELKWDGGIESGSYHGIGCTPCWPVQMRIKVNLNYLSSPPPHHSLVYSCLLKYLNIIIICYNNQNSIWIYSLFWSYPVMMIIVNVYLYSCSIMNQDPTMLDAPQAETKKYSLCPRELTISRWDGQKEKDKDKEVDRKRKYWQSAKQ